MFVCLLTTNNYKETVTVGVGRFYIYIEDSYLEKLSKVYKKNSERFVETSNYSFFSLQLNVVISNTTSVPFLLFTQ